MNEEKKTCPGCNIGTLVWDDSIPILDTLPPIYTYRCSLCGRRYETCEGAIQQTRKEGIKSNESQRVD